MVKFVAVRFCIPAVFKIGITVENIEQSNHFLDPGFQLQSAECVNA
ncbi:protein of unknown function [Shinella sp. WSC3-e]|nr:protein of unknown function [Shinella sp. WSC3-e]